MTTHHSTAKAIRLSEEALSRLYYSAEPTVDNFNLLRYKKLLNQCYLTEQPMSKILRR